jgi:asparagine synthase (glutamine-hydrolysing)
MKWGFTASVDAERLELEIALTPQSESRAPLVCLSLSESYAVVVAGRLFYRSELRDALLRRTPPPGAEGAGSSDSALALNAYVHFGTQGLARLEGDFCVLVFDHDKRNLIARCDPLGAYALFWSREGHEICFSTALRSVRDRLSAAPFNLNYLADFLVGGNHASPEAREACIYEHIHRVQTDEIVTINVVSGEISREHCWDWRDQIRDPGTDRLEEIAEMYTPLLKAAVRERMGTRTAAHLSGGMDSTSVCLLALNHLKAGVGVPPLHSLSMVYGRHPTLAQEAPFIDLVLNDHHEGLAGHRIVGDDILHFDIFRDPPPQDEPSPALWALGPDRALFAIADELRVDTLLTGEGADDFLHASTDHLSDLISNGRWIAAWRSAVAWAHVRQSNPWSILRNHGMADGQIYGRLGFLGRVLKPGPTQLVETGEASTPAWISANFAHEHSLRERAVAKASGFYRRGQSAVISRALDGLARRGRESTRSTLAAPLGIHISHPFLDQRVVGLGMGIQNRPQRPSKVRKPVLAEAMRGVLPEAIRTRRSKRPFNELLFHGYRRNQDMLKRLILKSPLNELGIFDHKIMIKCLEEAALGVALPSRLRGFNESLSLLAWGSSLNRSEAVASVQRICIPLRPFLNSAS